MLGTHLRWSKKEDALKVRGETVLGYCLCLLVRRAARVVAQVYDEALSPVNLTNGQFTLLAQISLRQPTTVTKLAHALHMDRTTLTRNLRHLSDQQAISESSPLGDRRRHVLSLTMQGERALAEALPRWSRAQAFVEAHLGTSEWNDALGRFRRLLKDTKGARRRSEPRSDPPRNISLHGALSAYQLADLRLQLCMCTTLRQCARATSKAYDDNLRPIEQRISQFHVLAALDALPGVRITTLIDVLTLDQTSLSRMVQRLVRLGLARYGELPGKRGEITITDKGKATFAAGWGGWKKAQASLMNSYEMEDARLLQTSLESLLACAPSPNFAGFVTA